MNLFYYNKVNFLIQNFIFETLIQYNHVIIIVHIYLIYQIYLVI